ncbi:MAG: N-acetylmuramoyl-L-alanine amidase [Candidatus Manganitrophus sp.]|nr:N-acetylmuramoyl-L-alanine amidase [Candidatus Manganitrophus sp.]
MIDPGHGGKDPGAIGVNGLEEKEVVLDVSLRLKDLIEKKLKKKVIMTRDHDVFIPLDERTLMANAKKADLFISVHANSSPKRSTQGVEVYFLGRATDDQSHRGGGARERHQRKSGARFRRDHPERPGTRFQHQRVARIRPSHPERLCRSSDLEISDLFPRREAGPLLRIGQYEYAGHFRRNLLPHPFGRSEAPSKQPNTGRKLRKPSSEESSDTSIPPKPTHKRNDRDPHQADPRV